MHDLLNIDPDDLPVGFWTEHQKSQIQKLPDLASFALSSIEFSDLASENLKVDIAVAFEVATKVDWERIGPWVKPPALMKVFEPGHYLNQNIRALWLNFDLSDSSGSLSETFWSYIVFHQTALGRDYYFSLISGLIKVTALAKVYDFRQLQICVDSLPPLASVLGIALPVHRNNDSCRLVIYHLHYESLVEYLTTIGWQGDPGKITKIKHLLTDRDLGLLIEASEDHLRDKIGIEVLIKERETAQSILKLLQDLQVLGLCLEPYVASIIEWQLKNEASSFVNDSTDHTKFKSWINHIKLTFDPGEPLNAKIYFGLQPRYHERD